MYFNNGLCILLQGSCFESFKIRVLESISSVNVLEFSDEHFTAYHYLTVSLSNSVTMTVWE